MGKGIIIIDAVVLADALFLPVGTTIDFIDKGPNDTHAIFGVSSPDLPETSGFEPITKLTPIYHKETQQIIRFDWNLKEKENDSETSQG